jgi:LysM repeat protein
MKKFIFVVVLMVMLSVATTVSAQGGGNVHYVRFGETLGTIADQYGISTQSIMGHNGISNPDLIYIGQPLIIPGNSAANYGAPTGCASYHVVTVGETLSGIAYNNGMSMQALMQQNGIYNSDLVYIGQKLCLTNSAAYASSTAGYQQPVAGNNQYHMVTSGETVSNIATRYGVSYADIMRANNINSAGFIMIGQKLTIPGYQPPVPAQLPGNTSVYYEEHVSYEEYHTYDNTPPPAPYAAPPSKPYSKPHYGGNIGDTGTTPPAPEHQPVPAKPILPEAEHPIEVVINGGVSWVGTANTIPDMNGITTLIVKTGQLYDKEVRIRSGDYEVKGYSDDVFLGEFGAHRFVFRHIPSGDFDVWIEDPDRMSEVVEVHVNAGDRAEVIFDEGVSQSGPTYASPDGWVLNTWNNPSKPKQNIGSWSNILVTAPASGLWIRIESEGGGYQAKCLTGSKGPGSCDFAGLSAGMYRFWIDGTGLVIKTYMDGAAYATFELGRQPSSNDDPNAVGPVDYTNQ